MVAAYRNSFTATVTVLGYLLYASTLGSRWGWRAGKAIGGLGGPLVKYPLGFIGGAIGEGAQLAVVSKIYDHAFLSGQTARKTDEVAQDTLVNQQTAVNQQTDLFPEVNGFGDLLQCPLPFSTGSAACIKQAWARSELAQTPPVQAARFVGNGGQCFLTKRGLIAKALCILSELPSPVGNAAGMAADCADESSAKASFLCFAATATGVNTQEIEDKISLATTFALLALAWFWTRPKGEEDKKELKKDFNAYA